MRLSKEARQKIKEIKKRRKMNKKIFDFVVHLRDLENFKRTRKLNVVITRANFKKAIKIFVRSQKIMLGSRGKKGKRKFDIRQHWIVSKVQRIRAVK